MAAALSAASGSRTMALRTLTAPSARATTAALGMRRPLSTDSTPPKPQPQPQQQQTTPAHLTWDRYLALRKQRRIAGIVTTVPATILAGLTSGSYFLTQEIDPSAPIAGIDPVYVYALLTLSCTGLGYLLGPSLGASIWSLAHRGHRAQIDEKDALFFQHIQKQRVDPSRQTMQNRLPDYYGEKIGSVRDYRQWLRDQAVFRRKAAHGVEDDEKAA